MIQQINYQSIIFETSQGDIPGFLLEHNEEFGCSTLSYGNYCVYFSRKMHLSNGNINVDLLKRITNHYGMKETYNLKEILGHDVVLVSKEYVLIGFAPIVDCEEKLEEWKNLLVKYYEGLPIEKQIFWNISYETMSSLASNLYYLKPKYDDC